MLSKPPVILGTVGSPSDPKSKNNLADVMLVQTLLMQAAHRLKRPAYNPGLFLPGFMNDYTMNAIRAFQSRFMPLPDGRIAPGSQSWKKLSSPTLGNGPYFPFSDLPAVDWTSGMRKFGASRSGGKRVHAGCDIYFPVGTQIYAVDSGTVVKGSTDFYLGTDEVCIYHDRLKMTIRYGEIGKGTCKLKRGETVEAGEPIAKVGKLRGLSITMLHIELYTGSVIPTLVLKNGKMGTLNGKSVPYLRLKSLIDPTSSLNQWKSRRPPRSSP